MDDLATHFTPTCFLHHAYLLVGWRPKIVESLREVLPTLHGGHHAPSIQVEDYDVFGIADSRSLVLWQSRRSSQRRQFFVLSFSYITTEAQNALLKVLEEPVGNSHFFLVSEASEIILPTLKSRLQIIRLVDKGGSSDFQKLADDFLKASLDQRLEWLTKASEDLSGANLKKFLTSLRASFPAAQTSAKDLSNLQRALNWSRTQATPVRLILEYLALVLLEKKDYAEGV